MNYDSPEEWGLPEKAENCADYNPVIVAQILTIVENGDSYTTALGLTKVKKRRWQAWIEAVPEIGQAMDILRKISAAAMVEECLDIADKAENAQVAKLQVDTRRWLAGILYPEKFGQKSSNEITGPDGGPIRFINERLQDLTDDERQAAIRYYGLPPDADKL